MNRRNFALVCFTFGFAATAASAQIIQRARQIRERRACEQDLPTCKPAIRGQLEAERCRVRLGLAGLAVAVLIGVGLLARRYVQMRCDVQEAGKRLEERMDSHARDSSKNQS